MSIKDKLLAKTSDLTAAPVPSPALGAPEPAPADGPAAALADRSLFPPVLPGPAPRTGPGQMMQFRSQMLAVEGELGQLRERLREHEGALPTRPLDPALVAPSRWANRHADSFQSAAFLQLKQDIESAGGNVQPILVRPDAERPGRYELVFGHRRHRACAELGLPVLAVIDNGPMSDQELFAAMDRENRARADLSPYEQGQMYRRALDEGLYPSNRRLAEALGVSHTWVANVLSVADLPPPVAACFRSTLEIQHRHARQLLAALEADRKGVLKRAEKLRQQPQRLPPAAVVASLVAGIGVASPAPGAATVPREGAARSGELRQGRRLIGRWALGPDGGLQLQLQPGLADGLDPARMAQAVADALAAAGSGEGARS